MIAPERLAFLRVQAANAGRGPSTLARASKEGRKIDLTHATMITISPSELTEFLRFYPEEPRDVAQA